MSHKYTSLFLKSNRSDSDLFGKNIAIKLEVVWLNVCWASSRDFLEKSGKKICFLRNTGHIMRVSDNLEWFSRKRRGGWVAEGSGLLNRRRYNNLPGVRIPPSPPFLCSKAPNGNHFLPFGTFLMDCVWFSSGEWQVASDNGRKCQLHDGGWIEWWFYPPMSTDLRQCCWYGFVVWKEKPFHQKNADGQYAEPKMRLI